MTDYVLVAADSSPGGTYVGFQRLATGTLTPSTLRGSNVTKFQDVTGSGDFVFAMSATVAQDYFTSITIFDSEVGEVTFEAANATFVSAGGTSTWTWDRGATALFTVGETYNALLVQDPFNCDCEVELPWKTLAEVRRKMIIRLGYAAQADNPPPGLSDFIDEFLRDAQEQIYMAPATTLLARRIFKWTMEPGKRYYGFSAEEANCRTLDVNKIEWAGFSDLNQAWYPLAYGIDPILYTRTDTYQGYPSRYEIRSCVEIWPAPQAAYTLRIKGDFGLDPLEEDTDKFTIPDQAVFLLALGNALTDRGKPGAATVLSQASNYVMRLVAATHKTARYIPRGGVTPPLTPPKFLPLGDEPS